MSGNDLPALEPTIVWSLFAEIARIPRCSGKEEKIRGWVKRWAENNRLPCKEDTAGNLLLCREASSGREAVPTLVLQAHLDMVCAKSSGSPVDFDRDPIPVYVEGDSVRSRGTTLGADNGIGIAYALAILADPELRRGPLEVLLTVDEEGGMKGAFGLQAGFFSGAYLLNLDSEELGLVTIGTAGGEYTDYSLPVRKGPAPGWKAIDVLVDGLAGGHSGIQIHLPRLNAIKVLTAGLDAVRQQMPLRIAAFEGGAAANVIPLSARCTVLVPGQSVPAALEILAGWRGGTLHSARGDEPGLEIAVRAEGPAAEGPAAEGPAADPPHAYCEDDTAAICGMLDEIPHGPLAFSRDLEGLVETSNNLSKVKSGEERFEIFTNARSSIDPSLEELSGRLRAIGERYGAAVKQHTRYPGWAANPRSPFNLFVKEQYEAVLGAPVGLKAFHAGLECGVFKGIAPDLEMVSLGPSLRSVHSPEEAIDIPSVAAVWRVLRRIVEHMDRMDGRS